MAAKLTKRPSVSTRQGHGDLTARKPFEERIGGL
jgi:hypothetical protein